MKKKQNKKGKSQAPTTIAYCPIEKVRICKNNKIIITYQLKK